MGSVIDRTTGDGGPVRLRRPPLAVPTGRPSLRSELDPCPATSGASLVVAAAFCALRRGPQARAALEPGQPGRGRVVAAHDDHLAVRLRAWFQEHRVHAHLGPGACRERLDILRAPDLEPIGRHGGVGAHVLGLERRNAQAPIGEIAAQRRRQQRLASVARAAHDHDRSPCHGSPLLGPSTVWTGCPSGKPSRKRRRARDPRRASNAPPARARTPR